jgi:hypothetical protein
MMFRQVDKNRNEKLEFSDALRVLQLLQQTSQGGSGGGGGQGFF